MPEIRPFRGTFYRVDKVPLDDVIAPPYDVISADHQDELYRRHPANVVRLILGKQDKTDDESDNRYTRAAAYLRDWVASDILTRSERPALYLYQQEFTWTGQTRTRNGLIAAVRIHDYADRKILPHEKTLPKPKADRLELMHASRANLEPVFCLYDDPAGEVEKTALAAAMGSPRGEATNGAGVISRIWEIDDPAAIAGITASLSPRPLYIADGHHRYETSIRYRDETLGRDGASGEGERPSDYVMMLLINKETDGMLVLATHRLIRRLDESALAALPRCLGKLFDVRHYPSSRKQDFFSALSAGRDKRCLGLYGAGLDPSSPGQHVFALLTPRSGWKSHMPADRVDAWNELDVSILHVLVLNHCLGISLDPGESKGNLDFEVDERSVISMVDSGEYQLAAFLNPTALGAVQAVADAGETMPQKSTYFYPKPASGMIIRELDPR